MLFIWPKLSVRSEVEAFAVFATGTDALSDIADGPETVSDEPTIIGVGDTLGTGAEESLIVGIESVTTTLTGVGVGSNSD
ncbi:MAG: hypothetical protein ABI857_00585 [Acidobacteriota bacterium]